MASSGKPEDIAFTFLTENESFLDINQKNLKFRECKETKRVNIAIFQQVYKGVAVQDKDVRVNLSKNGEIKFVKSNYYPHHELNVDPQITPENAIAVVKADLGVEELLQVTKKVSEEGRGEDEISTPVPELVIISGEESGNKAYLAWKFKFLQKDTPNFWYYAIDAHTGEIIVKRDNAMDWSVYGDIDGDIYPMDGGDSTQSEDLENLVAEVQRYNYGWISSGYDYTDDGGDYSITYPSYYLYHRILAGTLGSEVRTINDYTDSVALIIVGDYYPYLPSPINFDLDYSPSAAYSYFDCVNTYFHISESLEEYYGDNWGFNLGYRIDAWTHWGADADNAYYFPYPDRYLAFGHGYYRLKNTAHARDVILHELQHAVTDACYAWFPSSPNVFEAALTEAYSDYFAATQCGDFDHGDWVCNFSSDIRHMDDPDHVDDDDWDPDADPHINSLVISHALWHMYDDVNIGPTEADDLIFCSCEDYTPNSFNDLYNALTDYGNPSDPNAVEAILDAHWGDLL